MSNQQRMDEIASQFGDLEKISIYLGRSPIYPGKDVANETLNRLENALRSPESEKGTLRVLEQTPISGTRELIYRSSQGEVNFDPRNIAQKFQSNSLAQQPEISSVQQTFHKEVSPQEQSLNSENKTNNLTKDEFYASASFDSRSGRQIFSVPLNYNQPKLDEKMPKQADTVEVKTNGISSLNEPQPHRPPCQIFSIPINPTSVELDAKMPEVVNPAKEANRDSLEQALASANARIDALQAQLKDTQKSLENLSKFVRNDNLKSWAEHKVQEVAKTSQSVAQQAKTKVMQWLHTKSVQVKLAIHDKVNEVKTAAQGKVNEVKSVAQGKVNEVKEAAQLKGIEFKESVREQANKFLAPVNSAEVERAAKYIVREYGDGKSYSKASTHSFQLNDKNELSVTRQADGAVIYQQGELTKAASSHDILKLNALPNIVNQIKATQMQSQQKQQVEVGG